VAEPLFTEVPQIGIVTRDLDRVVRVWSDKYGVGPWSIYRFDPSNMSELTVHGKPVDYGMRIALAWIGPMMLEVLEPLDDRSVYAESLAKHGGADHLHHILLTTPDFDHTVGELRARGVGSLMGGLMCTGATFEYLETEDDLGFALEIARITADFAMPEPEEVYPPAG
jgi:methylmalonyl-CoA/ethylmalonyl-CoA epimerase